jgi:Zn-dependent metalloprotease
MKPKISSATWAVVWVLACQAIPLPAQRTPVPPDELARIRADEPRRIRSATERLAALRAGLGLADPFALEFRSALTDLYGRTHIRYRVRYKGVRVLGAGVIAHLDDADRFLEPTAKLFSGLDLDVTPAVSAATARAVIAQQLDPASAEPSIQTELVIVPLRSLLFTQDLTRRTLLDVPAIEEYEWVTQGFRLAWLALSSADDSSPDDREPAAWLVDASSAALIRRIGLRVNQERRPAPALGRSRFHGNVSFTTSEDTSTRLFELTDPTRGGNSVRNLDNQVSFKSSAAAPFRTPTNQWGDANHYSPAGGSASPNGQTAAVDVAFALERTWDALLHLFAHRGLDGNGAPFDARVHFGSNLEGAFWHKSAHAAFFGDGGVNAEVTPTDLETVAHELGHGFWFAFIDSDGIDGAESLGISEGHADIAASVVEFHHLAAQGRGPILPDILAPWNFRQRMVDPSQVGGMREWDASAIGRLEHIVGTIYGRMFVLLARGASADPNHPSASRFFPSGMQGLGVHQAAQLWYVATTSFLPDEPNFIELRQAFLRAAEVLYGSGSTGVRTVENAFAAVGLGAPAVDLSPPGVSAVTAEQVDEGEASMLVSAAAADDTGVVRVDFQVDGQLALTRTRQPFAGFVSIAGLAPGTHTLLAKAVDYTVKSASLQTSFGVQGANQILADPGFEDGAGWTGSAGLIRSGPESFLGARHAAFAGNATLSQRFRIPDTATRARLSFRLRVEAGSAGGRFRALLVDERGVLLETLAEFFDNAPTQDEVANHYAKRTFDLLRHRGRTLDLRFESLAPGAGLSFRLDNVGLLIEEPVSVTAEADADNGERSVVFRLRATTGLRPGQITRVDYSINGELAASSTTAPYIAVLTTQPLPFRVHSMVATAIGGGETVLARSAPVSFTVAPLEQMIANGGFELGGRGWQPVGQTVFGRDSTGPQRAFMGIGYALLGGSGLARTDTLFQRFTVPANATSPVLTFRLRVDTQDSRPNDALAVRILDEGGAILAEVGSFNNLTDTRDASSVRNYIKRSFDLTPFIGLPVQVQFQSRENTGFPTSFILDNVSATFIPATQ